MRRTLGCIWVVLILPLVCSAAADAASSHLIDTSYGELEYVLFPGDDSRAVIMLHGDAAEFSQQTAMMTEDSLHYFVADRLSRDTGKTVIALCRPGFGKSFGRRPGNKVTTSSTKRKHADAVVEGIDGIMSRYELGKVTIFGFSAGGRLGATYALRRPDKVDLAVLYEGVFNELLLARINGNKEKTQTDTVRELRGIEQPSAVRFIILYGEESKRVPPVIAEDFYDRLEEKGFDATLIGVEGAAHMHFFYPLVYDKCLEILKR